MKSKELTRLISEADAGDNLEVRIEPRHSMSSNEEAGDILVERIKTPDYIRVTKIYQPVPVNYERNRSGRSKPNNPNTKEERRS